MARGELGRAGWYAEKRLSDRDVQAFLGMCRGMLMDGVVQDEEIVRLEAWCRQNPQITGQWPADVIWARIRALLADGVVEEEERRDLEGLLRELVTGPEPEDAEASTELPLDDPCPEILFAQRAFVLTGTFVHGSRKACEAAVTIRGGRCLSGMSAGADYLVIGSRVTRAWAHATYGRRIQLAVDMRRAGSSRVRIVPERAWQAALAAPAKSV